MSTNFNNYKFRASSVGKLMVNGRSKSDPLSETTKTYLKELWIEEVFKRKRELSNKYLEKGVLVEEESISILSRVDKKFYTKNTEHFENDFIMGTPDITKPELIDIKSSWDIWTFADADGSNTAYYWQLQCYMGLLDVDTGRLSYVLTNSPEHLIFNEINKRCYIENADDDRRLEIEQEVTRSMTFDDIEIEKRVKSFNFSREREDIERMYKRVMECRNYLNNLSL